VIDLGDNRVLALLKLHFRTSASGLEMHMDYANLWTFDPRGAATRVEMFADVEKARAAAGLP
jgi:hypothetical protein